MQPHWHRDVCCSQLKICVPIDGIRLTEQVKVKTTTKPKSIKLVFAIFFVFAIKFGISLFNPFKVYNSMISMLCNHHLISRTFSSSHKDIPYPLPATLHCSSPQLPVTTNLVSVSVDFPILTLEINGIIPYVVFLAWFLLLIMFSRFIHVIACISSSFLYMAEYYFIV